MNLVVTTLLTTGVDPQRDGHLSADPAMFEELRASVACHGWDLVVLADELEPRVFDGGVVQPVDALGINPYVARWHHYRELLDALQDVDLIWFVDATDVEMLHDPTADMVDGVLYVGSEPDTVSFWWLRDNHPSAAPFIASHGDRPLVNAGIVGGDRATVLEFLDHLVERVTLAGGDLTDMGAFNETVWTRWAYRIATGETVHTVFRANDRKHPTAWWRHK